MVSQLLIALDQLGNTLIGGYADETISARAWRRRDKSKSWKITQAVIDGLFFLKPNHCYQAFVSERARMQMPPEYRN